MCSTQVFSNLKEAVEAYVQYSKTYKCTPLKVELLGALLEAKENELFNKAVKATEGVYGKPATNLSVVAALAEKGMEKSLRKFLSVCMVIIYYCNLFLKVV